MKKLLLAFILSGFIGEASFSQVNLIASFSRSFALSDQTVTVGNITTDVSFASMIGLNVGVAVPLVGNLEARTTAGYYLHFGASRTVSNGNSSTSSESFNIKRLSLGLAQRIKLGEKKTNLQLTAGFDFNFPGTLNIKFDDTELGKLNYDNGTGFYLGTGIGFMASDKVELVFGLAYRDAAFDINGKNHDSLNLSNDLIDLNADNIELGLTAIFSL